MKIATLGLVIENGKLLLGEKKKGEIGTGKLSGPGGKLDPGETLPQCLIRETREELGIELEPDSLEEVALIDFYAAEKIDFRVHVYRARIAGGDLRETADMIPAWYPLDALPYDRMYEADHAWMPQALAGARFRANVYYTNRAAGFDRIDLAPY